MILSNIVKMRPPYEISSKSLTLISLISGKIGEIKVANLIKPATELRKRNRIKTIQSSLGIEGNTLTIQQITDLINDKRILAPEKDILEVKNAINVYENISSFNVYKLAAFLKAHNILMNGLVDEPGKLRSSSVGILRGKKITHLAPPGDMVYPLIQDLFEYLKTDEELSLIKSCVFHYELEFIHPFTDGNGRMGRLWQTLILKEFSPVFEFLPIETIIKQRQKEYYAILRKSDNLGNSTYFIEFMLEIISTALEELLSTQNISVHNKERIILFKDIIGNKQFTRQDYLRHNKDISAPTASRDLKSAVKSGLLIKVGDKRTTVYNFK